jgi:hypothetical protein
VRPRAAFFELRHETSVIFSECQLPLNRTDRALNAPKKILLFGEASKLWWDLASQPRKLSEARGFARRMPRNEVSNDEFWSHCIAQDFDIPFSEVPRGIDDELLGE